MKKLIEYFDRTYIINLRDRLDRRRETIREFRQIGLQIPNGHIQFFTAARPSEQAGFPTLGSRGSYTSHRRVLDLALKDNLKNVLIFEDDVAFRKVDHQNLERILQILTVAPWDIVYFGYQLPLCSSPSEPLIYWSGDTIGGHFYAVNRAFIERMSRYMHECEARPVGHPQGGPTFRDGAYNNIRNLNSEIRTFLAIPSLATQRSSRTDLHPLKLYDRVKWTSPLISTLRTLKNRMRACLRDRT